MFGYLNLNDPRDIADNEAQEMVNCRLEKGYLEYNKFTPEKTPGRLIPLPEASSVAELFLDATFPANGACKYTMGTATKYDFGINWVAVIGITYAMAAGAVMPAGNYDYIFTLKNNTPSEESEILRTLPVVVTAGNHPSISGIPTITTNKTLVWNIYRMPLGGTEYLFVGSVANGTATFVDVVPDSGLGEAYDTSIRSEGGYGSSSLARHNGRVVICNYPSTVKFNASDQKFSTPLDHVFMPDGIVKSMFSLREALSFLTSKGIVNLYGNTPGVDGDMSMKTLDANLGEINFMQNTWVIIDGIAYFPYTRWKTITCTDTTPLSFYSIHGIMAFDGTSVTDITGKIYSLFPRMAYTDLSTFWDSALCDIFENRFFAFNMSPLRIADLPTFANGAAFISYITPYVGKNNQLCYDTQGKGFFLCDATTTWAWRSKEFADKGSVSRTKRFYVIGQGQFDVEVYAGGTKVTTHSLNLGTKTRVPLTCASYRASSFSFRFVGQTNAKIYEYGRLE